MIACAEKCMELKVSCPNQDCRKWIDYENDLNCVLVTIRKNKEKPMTLREVAPRMGVSFPRIKQIQDDAIKKVKRRMK